MRNVRHRSLKYLIYLDFSTFLLKKTKKKIIAIISSPSVSKISDFIDCLPSGLEESLC